jgi:hypothetical protein
MSTVRQEAITIFEGLSDQATWDDLMDRIYVRQKIERAIREADAGELISQEEIEREFLGE